MLAEFKSRYHWKQEKEIPKLDEIYVFAFLSPLNFELIYDNSPVTIDTTKLYFRLVDYWKNSSGEVVKAFYEEI